VAVITWLPNDRVDVEKEACPDPSKGTLAARTVPDSVNVTVPAGVPAAESAALTVAVNVTDCP